MSCQHYVSHQLTHFVGRAKRRADARYRVLKTILDSGQLLAKWPKDIETRFRAPYVAQRHIRARLSTNRAFEDSVVCFCDIPPGDLAIHMEKYGRFGVAFQKHFLVGKGATPVMYIPRDGRPPLMPHFIKRTEGFATNSEAFDEFYKRYSRLCMQFNATEVKRGLDVETRELARSFNLRREFIDSEFLTRLKFFDSFEPDYGTKNYYMEREWRIQGNLKFHLSDVQRVIIPEGFARRFRKDFPRYDGEMVFAE